MIFGFPKQTQTHTDTHIYFYIGACVYPASASKYLFLITRAQDAFHLKCHAFSGFIPWCAPPKPGLISRCVNDDSRDRFDAPVISPAIIAHMHREDDCGVAQ